MWPAIIAAGGSILGSALGGIFGIGSTNSANSANLQATRETNEANKQLAQQQNNFNYRMWQENNQYNSPLAQMRRFREAGLSGAAAAQAVSGVPSQPVQSANLANQVTPPPVQAPDYSFIGQNFIGIARELAALKKENAEANIAETNAQWQPDVILTKVGAEQAAWKLTMQQLFENQNTFGLRMNGMWLDNEGKMRYNRNLELMNQKLNQDIDLLQKQVNAFDRNNEINYQKSVQELRNLIKDGINKDKQGQLTDAQIANTNANTGKTLAETENVYKTGEQIEAVTEGQRINNSIQSIQKILAENGYPDNFQQRVASLMSSGQMSEDNLLKFVESLEKGQDIHKLAADGNFDMMLYYYTVFNEGTVQTIDKGTNILGNILGNVTPKLSFKFNKFYKAK
ncbi:MAG: hypothetical protein J6Q60_03870 [Bacteroidaceae bacterium]|nr:hypothetical protein [Bacteroidaceae bacterium]